MYRWYIDRKQEILFHYSFYDIPDDWLELVYYCVLERAWSCVYFIGNLDSISLEQYGFGAQQIYGGHVIACYEGSSKHVPVFMVRIRFSLDRFPNTDEFSCRYRCGPDVVASLSGSTRWCISTVMSPRVMRVT